MLFTLNMLCKKAFAGIRLTLLRPKDKGEGGTSELEDMVPKAPIKGDARAGAM